MIINLIRHGKTPGNLTKRYIGVTDESLCGEGIIELKKLNYPECDVIVTSPMKRCMMTAQIIYPGRDFIVRNDFRECDFGDFEGKNYLELSDDKTYRDWINSGGNVSFPNGESPDDFKKRCTNEFLGLTAEFGRSDSLSLIVHGGTVMAIMERFSVPYRNYFDWQIDNGHGYITEFDGKIITVLEKI